MAGCRLVRATLQQYRQSLVNNYVEWGAHLTLEQYLAREETLRSQPFARCNDAHTSWVLVPSDNILTLDLLAHCETYSRPVLVSGEGEVVEKICYSVASVFVPVHLRVRGYGKS